MSETRKSLPWPFNYAKHWYAIELQENDIDYINSVIISNKMYRLIRQAHEINTSFIITTDRDEYNDPRVISIETLVSRSFVETSNADHFFEQFLDDENCPPRVKCFLYKWIGDQRGAIKLNGMYGDYVLRSFLTESWFRTVCVVRRPKKHTMPKCKKHKKKHKPRIRGIMHGTLQPKLCQNLYNMPTIYMFFENTKKR